MRYDFVLLLASLLEKTVLGDKCVLRRAMLLPFALLGVVPVASTLKQDGEYKGEKKGMGKGREGTCFKERAGKKTKTKTYLLCCQGFPIVLLNKVRPKTNVSKPSWLFTRGGTYFEAS